MVESLAANTFVGGHVFEEKTSDFRWALYPNSDVPVLEQAVKRTHHDKDNKPVNRSYEWRKVPTVIVDGKDAPS